MAQIGLRDLHFALNTLDDETSATYDTPEKIGPAITATVTHNNSTTDLYAEDGVFDTADAKGPMEVSFSTADLPLAVQATLLGATINAEGELVESKDDKAPDVALLFRSLKHDGTYRYVKLLKGKFRKTEETYNTKGESVEYTNESLTGRFVPRVFDGQTKRTADDGQNEFAGGSAWFDNVEAPAV